MRSGPEQHQGNSVYLHRRTDYNQLKAKKFTKCGYCYMGQTGGGVKQRIKEHDKNARLKKIWQVAVVERIHEAMHQN